MSDVRCRSRTGRAAVRAHPLAWRWQRSSGRGPHVERASIVLEAVRLRFPTTRETKSNPDPLHPSDRERIIGQLDHHRLEWPRRDDLGRVALACRVLHEPSIPDADRHGIAYTRSDPHAPGKAEQDLTPRRPVALAAPTGWQLEHNEPRRRRQS